MFSGKKELITYETPNGHAPFDKWLEGLKDRKGRAIIRNRLDRFEQGNPGHYDAVGHGVYELKIDFGPGYRVYFGEDKKVLVILLCGGDKKSQRKDIKQAHQYWEAYRRLR